MSSKHVTVRAGCPRGSIALSSLQGRSRCPRESGAALASIAALSLLAIGALSLLAGEIRAAEPERPSDVPPESPYVEFYMGEVLVKGWVIAADWEEETFHFYDAMARAQIPNVPLAQLPVTDISRLRKWAGEDAAGEGTGGFRPTGGEDIEATKYFLKTGRSVVGIEFKERSTKNTIYVRARNAPLFSIPRDQVERTESVKVRETDIFSVNELYAKWRVEIDPESGGDHYDLAERLRRIGNWVAARDHYKRAKVLDPRIETQAKERLAELEVIIQAQVVDKLDTEIQRHCRAERFREALTLIGRLGILDPRSPAYLRWMEKMDEIEKKLLQNLRRELVGSYYRKMDELIRKWAWGRVVRGESIIGKIVQTRNGVYTGRFISEDEDYMTLEREGREIRIDKTMIIGTPKTTEMNPKRREATFAESQAYVTDVEGGLTADIMSALVKQYGEMIIAYRASQGDDEDEGGGDFAEDAPMAVDIFDQPETADDEFGGVPGDEPGVQVEAMPHEEVRAEIKAYWERRLEDVVIVTPQGTVHIPPAATQHEASWTIGTWLRPGVELKAMSDGVDAPDPERWWKSLRKAREVRYHMLRAMAAEALCEIIRETETDCSNCGGKAYVTKYTVAGRVGQNICPVCKGVGVVVKIKYR